MITGTQSDLIRHLKSEYGKTCTRAAISNLVKAKDFRIQFTPGGKIIIDKSAKALVDSGFPKMQANKKKKEYSAVPDIPFTEMMKRAEEQPEKPEEIDFTKPLSLEDSRELIEKHKAFHQAEKERINNAIKEKEYFPRHEIEDKSFELFRKIRDGVQSLTERTAVKIRSAESDHEARKLLKDETHRILTSIVGDYEDDAELKKKIMERLI